MVSLDERPDYFGLAFSPSGVHDLDCSEAVLYVIYSDQMSSGHEVTRLLHECVAGSEAALGSGLFSQID